MAIPMETMGKIKSGMTNNQTERELMGVANIAKMEVNANIIQNNVLATTALHLAFTKLARLNDGTDKQ